VTARWRTNDARGGPRAVVRHRSVRALTDMATAKGSASGSRSPRITVLIACTAIMPNVMTGRPS
jgi:hypothetical protein